MYKEQGSDYFKSGVGLPNTYKVDAFLSYGSWDKEQQENNIKKHLSDISPNSVIKNLNGFLSDIYEIKTSDNKCVWFSLAYGVTKYSEYLHMASIFGSKKNIHLGSCGGLNVDINAADIIIPTKSYGNESVNRMYQRDNSSYVYTSNAKLNENLKNAIGDSFTVHEGPIMTTQGMLAETEDDVKEWSKNGYLGVEMETSVLFAVSNHFNVPASALIYISDNLARKILVDTEDHKNTKELREKTKAEIYRVALKEILST